jgi:DNA-directed RNA polymerase subunit RPC12/RpoP
MRLVSITCPHCGAKLQTTSNAKILACDYCNNDVMIDDEVKRVCLADAEHAGYEFEMGRQRALKELREDEEMMNGIGPLF